MALLNNSMYAQCLAVIKRTEKGNGSIFLWILLFQRPLPVFHEFEYPVELEIVRKLFEKRCAVGVVIVDAF